MQNLCISKIECSGIKKQRSEGNRFVHLRNPYNRIGGYINIARNLLFSKFKVYLVVASIGKEDKS
jgi:hypothetical protein